MQKRGGVTLKRVFADLHVCLSMNDSAATLRMISKTAKLGYRLIAAPLAPETNKEEVVKLRKACNEAKIDFASRIDLQPRTTNELMVQLRRLRRKFEIISVACDNKQVARQAAKDRRVDLLSFPFLDFRRRFFDRAEAELASNSLAALEFDMKPLLVLHGPARLRQEAAIAMKFHVPIIVSSGVAIEMLLRKPRDMAALACLFGLDENSALDAVSHIAHAIVKRNREKLGSGFVAPGIHIIREGKNR